MFMKKIGKQIVKMVVILLAILGLGTTVLATGGYIQWSGTEDFNEAMENLNLIEQRGVELKNERDMANATNEQLQNIIRDKENIIRDKDNLITAKEQEILAKEQEILAKEQEIESLRNQQRENSSQLEQAEKDMKDINNKTKQVLNGLE
jgi:uncharacterized protein YecE (DUF72 family)